jgi:hypothetical protein
VFPFSILVYLYPSDKYYTYDKYPKGGQSMKYDAIEMISSVDMVDGGAVASAATLTPTPGGNRYNVTGTVGITAIAATAPSPLYLKFDDACIITHNATTLKLPDSQSITTKAGDIAIFFKDAADYWCCFQFQRLGGLTTSPQVDHQGNDLNSYLTSLQSQVDSIDDAGDPWQYVDAGGAVTVGGTHVTTNRDRIFFDTTAGSFTVELPGTPTMGYFVELVDVSVGDQLSVNPITITRANGSNDNIMGSLQDVTVNQDNISLTFLYVNPTLGWRIKE